MLVRGIARSARSITVLSKQKMYKLKPVTMKASTIFFITRKTLLPYETLSVMPQIESFIRTTLAVRILDLVSLPPRPTPMWAYWMAIAFSASSPVTHTILSNNLSCWMRSSLCLALA